MFTPTTQEMVESLTSAYCAQHADIRQRHVFEQTLHALVRLAKSEQMLEIKASVKKLTGAIVAEPERRQTKVIPRG